MLQVIIIFLVALSGPLALLLVERPRFFGKSNVHYISSIVATLMCVSFFLDIVIMSSNNKYFSYLDKLFLEGRIEKHRFFVAGNELIDDHYETEYQFHPSTDAGNAMVHIIEWTAIIICLATPFVQLLLLGPAFRLEDKFEP